MNFPERGDIYLVSLDPTIGSEIGKSRPAIVISNNINNEFADTVTIIPVTSKTTKVYPFEVLLKMGEAGLTKDSKAKCNQIRTVDKKRLFKFLGSINNKKMEEIEKALLIHLGIIDL